MPTSSRARRRMWSKASARSAKRPRRAGSRSTKRSRASRVRRERKKSSLPGLTPQVGFTRLAAHKDTQLGQARVAVQSIQLCKNSLTKEMDARVISAFTRVFDALLPAHDPLKERRSRECHAGVLG